MSVIQSSISDIALAVKAKFSRNIVENSMAYDAYESAPLRREELETLFDLNDPAVNTDVPSESLRESERLERETMSMIRGALYAD